MLIEQTQREARVRFQHPIRVVTLEGQPRVIRTLTSNVSRDGLFVRMPEPLPPGMKVALSLEAGGRALALAQAEVRWNGPDANEITERFPGCGVRFTEFLHPRAEELVRYLVKNLDTGKPLALAPPEKRWMKWLPFAGGGALLACAAAAAVILWDPGEVQLEEPEETPAVQLQAGTPTVLPLPSGEGRGEGKSPSNPTTTAAPESAAPTVEAVAEAPPPPTRAEHAVAQPAPEPSPEPAPLVAKVEVPKVPAAAPTPPGADPVTAPKPQLESAPVAKVATAPVELKVEAPKAAPPAADPVAASKPKPESVPVAKVAIAPVELKVEAPKAAQNAPKTEPALVAKPAIVAAAKPAPASAKKKAERQGDVKLAAGASPQLHWEVTGTELRLVPQLPDGVQLSRAFVLTGPARAVFDLTGGAAARSLMVPAAPPYATGVRIGKQPAGTRIVVDLDTAPKNTKQLGDALVLAF